MLQKLRRALVRPERDRLSAIVEVDETDLGGVEAGRRGGRQRDSDKGSRHRTDRIAPLLVQVGNRLTMWWRASR
jgi:hypothetical protein